MFRYLPVKLLDTVYRSDDYSLLKYATKRCICIFHRLVAQKNGLHVCCKLRATMDVLLSLGVLKVAQVTNAFCFNLFIQVHDKYDKPYKSRRKRNLAITGAVTLSVLASPILAALTVGVGVPIALGYIYGVVPVSLCRSGGCATVTNIRNGKGVNLDFDDDGDPGTTGVPGTFGTSRSSSRSSMRGGDKGSTTGVVTVVATVNNRGAGNQMQCI